MSARRQSSTTSLAKYARTTSPDTSNRNLDFCNAFWGPGDGGVDVLFARMRGAARTMEELKNFWKERYAAASSSNTQPPTHTAPTQIIDRGRLCETTHQTGKDVNREGRDWVSGLDFLALRSRLDGGGWGTRHCNATWVGALSVVWPSYIASPWIPRGMLVLVLRPASDHIITGNCATL
jgi:hypothetical protein